MQLPECGIPARSILQASEALFCRADREARRDSDRAGKHPAHREVAGRHERPGG
jgi:hypothetical protein